MADNNAADADAGPAEQDSAPAPKESPKSDEGKHASDPSDDTEIDAEDIAFFRDTLTALNEAKPDQKEANSKKVEQLIQRSMKAAQVRTSALTSQVSKEFDVPVEMVRSMKRSADAWQTYLEMYTELSGKKRGRQDAQPADKSAPKQAKQTPSAVPPKAAAATKSSSSAAGKEPAKSAPKESAEDDEFGKIFHTVRQSLSGKESNRAASFFDTSSSASNPI